MCSSQTMPYLRDSMPEKVKALNNQEELAGFMFMFDHLKMPVKFGVLDLPGLRKEVLQKIRPGMYLFFYDILAMFLYGMYTTTSSAKLRTEESATGPKFSAQVEFQHLQDCKNYVPLTGRMIKNVIQDNFHKDGQKFSPELNLGQVKSLLLLFLTDPINELISMPTSAPEQSMQYQTSKSQLHLPASPLGVQNTYSAGNSGSVGESVPEPQPEHRSLTNMGDTICGPSSQSSLLAHRIYFSPQTNPSFSLLSFGGVYDEPLADPQDVDIQNSESNFHNISSSQAQSISDPQHVNSNVVNPQPNFNPYVDMGYANPIMQNPQSNFHLSTVNMSSSQTQSISDPQHVNLNVLNPQPNFNPYADMGYANPSFHSSTENMSSSQAQSISDTQYINPNVLNPLPNFNPFVDVGYTNPIIQDLQSNFHSSTVNMSNSQIQSISDPQYINPNVLNLLPNLNPYVDVGYANPTMQSLASSPSRIPYYSDHTGHGCIPEALTSAANPYQGVFAGKSFEAAEGIMHGDQQTCIGNECLDSSLQACIDNNHQQ